MCGQFPETIQHILWECTSANAVWTECNKTVQKLSIVADDGLTLVSQLMGKLEEKELLLALCLMHRLWLRRNIVVFGGHIPHPGFVVTSTVAYLDEYQQSQRVPSATLGALSPQQQQIWRRPPMGVVKINWDAALDKVSNKMGVGVVIRDEGGFVLASLCASVKYITDPTFAEALAAWKASELCKNSGLQRVILEGDSLIVVQALQEGGSSWRPFGQLIEDTRDLLNGLLFWKVSHVKREANEVAHRLAKAALQKSLEAVWYNYFPSCIQSLVLAEQES